MLESMIHNPRPTRAEASDVANAIFDGTDAVMLSAETASGEYPVKAVEMMDSIVCQAEEHLSTWGHWKGTSFEDVQDDAIYVTRAAREVAFDRNVAAIAVFTNNGRSALLTSKERPKTPILAFTPNQRTYQRLGMYWGVKPHLIPKADTVEMMLEHVEAVMVTETPVQPGQQVVLVCGFPVNAFRSPNLVLVHTVRGL
jgi:pyruvate kinase